MCKSSTDVHIHRVALGWGRPIVEAEVRTRFLRKTVKQ